MAKTRVVFGQSFTRRAARRVVRKQRKLEKRFRRAAGLS